MVFATLNMCCGKRVAAGTLVAAVKLVAVGNLLRACCGQGQCFGSVGYYGARVAA